MSVTREFKLSLFAGRSVPLLINANQYDSGETWIFTLLDELGQKYTPTSGSIVGLKSDGHIIADVGTVNTSGQVVITETEQMTAAPGRNTFEILIDNDVHGSANFVLMVEPRPGDQETPSDSDLSMFQEAIDAAAAIGNTANLIDEVAVLGARMDTFTTLTEGSTTGDAELADIRVSAYGTTYPTAGDAVRGQVNTLTGTDQVVTSYVCDNSELCVWIKGININDSGAIGTTNYYATSNLFPASYIYNETPLVDSDNINLQFNVIEYNSNYEFISKSVLRRIKNFTPSATCKYMRLNFGRVSSSGITVSDDDISYINVKLFPIVKKQFVKENEVVLDEIETVTPYGISSAGELVSYVSSPTQARFKVLSLKNIIKGASNVIRVYSSVTALANIALFNKSVIAKDETFNNIIIAKNSFMDIDTTGYKYMLFNISTSSGINLTPYRIVTDIQPSDKQMQEVFTCGLAHSDDYGDLIGYDSTKITASGYNPDAGYENRVKVNKYCVCDTMAIKAVVSFDPDTNAVFTIGTEDSGFTASKHATVVKFDFTNEVVQFLTGAEGGGNVDGSTLPAYVYDSFSLSLLSGNKYTVEVGRIDRCVYAKVWNRTTGNYCGGKVLTEYLTSAAYGGKAGACYDYPTFAALTDNVIFERVSVYMPSDVFVAFLGDSITEGSQTAFVNSWANMASAQIGNGVNFGRGGGNIDHAQKCVNDILSIIKPKYVVVTIGTNGGNTSAKLDALITSIKAFGGKPVLNCIPRKTSSVTSVNDLILSKNTEHCRFDIATSVDNDLSKAQDTSLFYSDELHPNIDGHIALYKSFMADFSCLKNE